jgi:hypothetical protein
MLGGIANFTVNTPIILTSCFWISSFIPIYSMQIGLGTSLIWVGIAMVFIENKSSSMANNTSSFLSDILEWKS